MCHRLIAALSLFVSLLPAAASAAATDEVVGVQIREVVALGRERPALTVEARRNLAALDVVLRSGSRLHSFRARKLRRGKSRTFEWDQRAGTTRWEATLVATLAGKKKAEMRFAFSTTVLGELKLRVDRRDVDLAGRCVKAHMNRAIARVELVVYGDGGRQIERFDRSYTGDDGDRKVCWHLSPQVLERLDLKVWDRHGFWAGVQVIPFQVLIPHDDLIFETGRWEIRPGEAHKLKATLEKLEAALKRHGKLITIELYVAGHTDTVGSEADNQRLSGRRAQAIARWFRGHGVRIPIFYRGFGERRLKVRTPDDTGEARNRRADYILSNGAPAGLPPAGWKRL